MFTNLILMISVINLVLSTIPSFRLTQIINGTEIPMVYDGGAIDNSVSIAFAIIEFICVGWFTIEVIIRYLISYSNRQFFTCIYNLIDIFVLVIFFLWLCLSVLDIKILKEISRMLKILRLFKCSRYSQSLNTLGDVVIKSLKEITILLFYLIIFVLIFSSFVYYMEINEPSSNYSDGNGFSSIPKSFWYVSNFVSVINKGVDILCLCRWAIITMTTVGYGDIVPLTIAGRICAAITALCGILVIAMPVAVIGTKFSVVFDELHKKKYVLDEFQKSKKMR